MVDGGIRSKRLLVLVVGTGCWLLVLVTFVFVPTIESNRSSSLHFWVLLKICLIFFGSHSTKNSPW